MVISPRISGFSILDASTLRLATPHNEMAFAYASALSPVVALPVPVPKKATAKVDKPVPVLAASAEEKIPAENLLASALGSPVSGQNGKTASSAIFIFAVLFVGASAGGVYFIRRGKVVPQAGSEFELLDE
jgi:hypothetical protein